VFLSEEDLSRLLEWSGLAATEFVEEYCTWVPFGMDAHLSLGEQDNKDCVFWADGGCSVYPARPLQCRTYPFWQTIVDEEEHWREESAECPGIGLGVVRSAEEIASLVAARRSAPPMLRSVFQNGAM
jgi:Fe-S-cluster containining protein